MDYLNWDLSVLHRAVGYPNLSGAAAHVGLSQPQLSRIVARVESQLGVNLLDRDAKRRAAWTPAAHQLAEIYASTFRKFSSEVNLLVEGNQLQHIRVGTLEGMADLAMELAEAILKSTEIRILELNVHDLNELEQAFGKHDLELIFTSREPGKKKYRNIRTLGYQTVRETGSGNSVRVMSTYEYGSDPQYWKSHGKSFPDERVLVSNSLEVRKRWLKQKNTHGRLPSPLRKKASGNEWDKPVLLIGSDDLSSSFWEMIGKVKYTVSD